MAYAPADAEIGACLFFKGVSLSHLDRLAEALACFLLALDSPWALKSEEQKVHLRVNLRDEQDRRDSVREHNRMICLFAVAKALQREKKHVEAIEYFTKALEVLPLDKDIAFVHFRRAWSYKVPTAALILSSNLSFSSLHFLLLSVDSTYFNNDMLFSTSAGCV